MSAIHLYAELECLVQMGVGAVGTPTSASKCARFEQCVRMRLQIIGGGGHHFSSLKERVCSFSLAH